jgi:DNA-binding transcriptional ArsR family regulator
MVRRTTRIALVLLAVLSVTGLPVADFGGDANRAAGHAAATGPLTTAESPVTTDLLTTTEVGITTTDATSTETTIVETTTAETTIRTTTTDDSLVGTTTLSGEVTNGTDEVTNATNLATNTTRTALDSAPRTGTDTVPLPTARTSTRLSFTATSSFVGTATDTLDEADGVVTTRSSSGGGDAPADRPESRTTTASEDSGETERESAETTTTRNSAEVAESPDRRRPARPPRGPALAVGVGALTAAALLPQLADGLALVGNAGLVSASSVLVGPTGVRRSLRSRFDRLWRFGTLFRYSQWDDSDPLDHEGRAALYEAIEESPGAYLSAVCESAEVPVSTARHHLDVLEAEGLVTTAKVRGKRRFYPGHAAADAELVAALEDEGTAPVLHALARLGDSHGGRLADELDRDPSTVSHHLSRLEDAGLVEREREDRAIVNRLAPEVRSVLRGTDQSDGETPAVAD